MTYTLGGTDWMPRFRSFIDSENGADKGQARDNLDHENDDRTTGTVNDAASRLRPEDPSDTTANPSRDSITVNISVDRT